MEREFFPPEQNLAFFKKLCTYALFTEQGLGGLGVDTRFGVQDGFPKMPYFRAENGPFRPFFGRKT